MAAGAYRGSPSVPGASGPTGASPPTLADTSCDGRATVPSERADRTNDRNPHVLLCGRVLLPGQIGTQRAALPPTRFTRVALFPGHKTDAEANSRVADRLRRGETVLADLAGKPLARLTESIGSPRDVPFVRFPALVDEFAFELGDHFLLHALQVDRFR